MTARVASVLAGLALLGLLVLLGAPEAIRAPVAAGNLLLAPGLALTAPGAPAARVLAVSFASGTLAVTALLVAGAYAPATAAALLALVCLAGCGTQLWTSTRNFEIQLLRDPRP